MLAYSGSLATTVAIPWLAEEYGAEIVTVTMDVGQGQALEAVRDCALAAGAARAHVLDLRDEFAREHVLRSLKADAGDRDRFLMTAGSTALEWPLIAQKLLDIADIEQAAAIAHGSAGQGEEAHLDRLARALNPTITIIAPARNWGMTRADQLAYARARGISVPSTVDRSYHVDVNLWGRAIENGAPADASTKRPEGIYALTRSPIECPDEPAYVEIAFTRGVPADINGVAMPLVELVASLGTIAGAHGVGRIDGPANRMAYESPAAVVLHRAHRALQEIVSTTDARRVSDSVSLRYADIIRNGLWFTSVREALETYVETMQECVTGVVRLKLFKGDCQVVGVTSAFALSDESPASGDVRDAFDRAATIVTSILGSPLGPAQEPS